MRIAVLTTSYLPVVGGLEWKVHFLSEECVRRGHDVTVFTTHVPKAFRSDPMPVRPSYRLIRRGHPIAGFGRLGIVKWLICRGILAEHARNPFDILHCHHLGSATQWGVFVKRKTGLPIVATTCGEDVMLLPEMNYGDRLQPRFDRIVRENVRHVDVIGSISSAVRADLEELRPSGQIVNLPNGVAWDEFQVGRSDYLRRKLGLGEETILILSLGRNHFVKDYETGLRAFASVAECFQNTAYAIIGREATKLQGLVESLGLKGRVFLVEQLGMGDMPAVLHSADIFFNPSMIEGFAQVNAQALACGLPLVITDAPGNLDAGADGGAVIARRRDSESMAAALTRLIEDGELRRRLGNEAHRASRRYAWSAIADAYIEIYRGLIPTLGCSASVSAATA